MTWEKGQSGNPAGRPKGKVGKSLTAILRRSLTETDAEGRPKSVILANTLWTLAIAGNLDAIKYIYDRLDGKPTQATEVSGPNGGPVPVGITEMVVELAPEEPEGEPDE